MEWVDCVNRLALLYPEILKHRERKAHGKRRLATLCAIFQASGLSKDAIAAQLARDLSGASPEQRRHITATTLSFWSGA